MTLQEQLQEQEQRQGLQINTLTLVVFLHASKK
jgi:hypothetical protein